MNVTYTKQGDYLLPNLTLASRNNENIGKYGLMRLNYLKQHQKALYQDLLIRDELTNHLVDIDKLAYERVENIVKSLSEKNNISEELKSTDQIKWVALINGIKSNAEEIVLNELIYNQFVV